MTLTANSSTITSLGTCYILTMPSKVITLTQTMSIYTLTKSIAMVVLTTQSFRTTRTTKTLKTLTSLTVGGLDAISVSRTATLTNLFSAIRARPSRWTRAHTRRLVTCSCVTSSDASLVFAHHERTVLERHFATTHSLFARSSIQTVSRAS